jgi:hypothetical protein
LRERGALLVRRHISAVSEPSPGRAEASRSRKE